MSNINVAVITGNLTKDPELRHTGAGTAVCEMRVAVNTARKNGQTGEWEDKANYFDVVVWGKRGVACAENLVKGRGVAVEGRLDWQEWEAKDGSGKRQTVKIVAKDVQFLPQGNGSKNGAGAEAESEAPAEAALAGVAGGDGDGEIPF